MVANPEQGFYFHNPTRFYVNEKLLERKKKTLKMCFAQFILISYHRSRVTVEVLKIADQINTQLEFIVTRVTSLFEWQTHFYHVSVDCLKVSRFVLRLLQFFIHFVFLLLISILVNS